MSRIVITTWGSLGDLHPYLAVGLGLLARGHDVVLATCPCYERRINALGLGFRPVRPDVDWMTDERKMKRYSHRRLGLLRVSRELLMPALRDTYEDTLKAAEGADLLVAMLATYATRLVAEVRRIPWVSAVHVPMAFFSAYQPPVFDVAPVLSKRLRMLGPWFWRPLQGGGKRATRFLARPWYRLRADIGLPPATHGNPLADSHSPGLVLALFSPCLGDRQPDWPPATVISGTPVFEGDGGIGLDPELERFLNDGPPPLVFTLGSAVSMRAGEFFEQSAACADLLKRRAVLVVGRSRRHWPASTVDRMVVEYAPYHQLFPRSAAVVHHGGVGTTSLAMRSGRPMVVVPFAWDQPDNADRVVQLGVAKSVPGRRYNAKRAALALRCVLEDSRFASRAGDIAERMNTERGVATACDALEDLLGRVTVT